MGSSRRAQRTCKQSSNWGRPISMIKVETFIGRFVMYAMRHIDRHLGEMKVAITADVTVGTSPPGSKRCRPACDQ